jgi:hypothetical protein
VSKETVGDFGFYTVFPYAFYDSSLWNNIVQRGEKVPLEKRLEAVHRLPSRTRDDNNDGDEDDEMRSFQQIFGFPVSSVGLFAFLVILGLGKGQAPIFHSQHDVFRYGSGLDVSTWVRSSRKDICTSWLTNNSTWHGRLWLEAEGLGHPIKRVSSVVDVLHSTCSAECALAIVDRTVLWVAGPPGSGKTTVTKRLQNYGFNRASCGFMKNFSDFKALSEHTVRSRPSAVAFDACGSAFLKEAPAGVVPILLLPEKEVYTRRWLNRNPNDTQDHEGLFDEAVQAAKHPRTRIIYQPVEECVDQTVWRICNAISRLPANFAGATPATRHDMLVRQEEASS